MDEIFVREADKQDLQKVLALYRQLHPQDLPSPPERELTRTWSRICSSSVIHCYVAELEGRIVATGTLAVLPNLTRGGRPYGLIENMVTDEDSRRLGIGKELLRHIMREAQGRGCYKLMVLTDVCRRGVVEFYEAVGFRTGVKNGLVALAPFDCVKKT
jgi:GNAT superfamily N-acetyltransferase